MKISYTNPETGKRTSITLNDHILHLWAIINGLYTNTDNAIYDKAIINLLKVWISKNHQSYLKNKTKHPTLVSYLESIIFIDVKNQLLLN